MVSAFGSEFSRRPERNGTIVSTCNTCFAAVAGSRREMDVEAAEHDHTCNPQAPDLWKMFVREIQRNDRRRERIRSI